MADAIAKNIRKWNGKIDGVIHFPRRVIHLQQTYNKITTFRTKKNAAQMIHGACSVAVVFNNKKIPGTPMQIYFDINPFSKKQAFPFI